MKVREIVVSDLMQTQYRYFLSEPEGKNYHRDFHPELTPPAMLRLGVFGGRYMTDCRNEFPEEWFAEAKLCPARHDPTCNFFGVLAGLPRSEWLRRGWITPEDPRGWFQWFCRYFRGRRGPDDQRQIGRWKAMTRHLAQVQYNCDFGDAACRPRQRQALLQWAYDSRRI